MILLIIVWTGIEKMTTYIVTYLAKNEMDRCVVYVEMPDEDMPDTKWQLMLEDKVDRITDNDCLEILDYEGID